MQAVIGQNEYVLPAGLSGDVLSKLCSQLGVLYVSSVFTAGAMRPITFFQYGNGLTLSGRSETYDQSIIDHALYVRRQRDATCPATTSRDTEA